VYIGSVKTNIGHLEAAAGIAGLIKVVLTLQHGEIPGQLNFEQPNAMIAWDALPFRVPRALTAWPGDSARRVAGVSSFGFVGTNSHVVLESAPVPVPVERNSPKAGPHLLCLSARTPDALEEVRTRYAELLGSMQDTATGDVCVNAATDRAHFRHRLALVADSAADLRESLEAARQIEQKPARRSWRAFRSSAVPSTASRVVFLFTGQGAQYPGMARHLYQRVPEFRHAFDHCLQALQPHLSVPLLSVLHPASADDARIDQTEFSQPALFALEWSLAQMWRAWGVTPAALIGHSIGEYAAACVAGVFSLEDAAELVVARGGKR
jgi:acyl transferase domain-containing protein